MANIASVLKDEISRLSRKQIRTETDGFKRASGQYRSDIAALKKRVSAIERQLRRLDKSIAGSAAPAAQTELAASAIRFSGKGLLAQRRRLELSAAEAGFLLNVSAQTVYNWETGKTRPRATQLEAIAALRSLNKRVAKAILANLKQT